MVLRSSIIAVTCDWDHRKNIANQREHRIDFADACLVFQEPYRFDVLDDREYDEDRWIAIGMGNAVVLAVVHTMRNDRERIISARKAEPSEEAEYYARFA